MCLVTTAREANVFRSVCLFTGGLPLRDLPLGGGEFMPPGGSAHPPPHYSHLVVATAAVATNPAGMHSCLCYVNLVQGYFKFLVFSRIHFHRFLSDLM